MMYICKDGGCQAIWHSMIQRKNTKMNTTMKTVQKLYPYDYGIC